MPDRDYGNADKVTAARALLVALLVALCGACGGEDETEQTCTEGGKTHRVGESWTCADGCNRCSCSAPGTYTSTGMACIDAGAPDARSGG